MSEKDAKDYAGACSSCGKTEKYGRCMKECNLMSPGVAKFSVKEVYGQPLHYPENTLAQFLCDLANTTTLTTRTFLLAEDFGIEFEQVMRKV